MKKASCLLVIFWLLGCGTERIKKIGIVPNLETGKDAIIASAYKTKNYRDFEILHLISRIKHDTIKDENRIVFSFDMEHIDRNAKIDSAFIGSCTNGRYEDMKLVSEILNGRKVAPGVVLKIVPATDEIWQRLLEEGIIKIFKDAGALVSNAGCAGCAYEGGSGR